MRDFSEIVPGNPLLEVISVGNWCQQCKKKEVNVTDLWTHIMFTQYMSVSCQNQRGAHDTLIPWSSTLIHTHVQSHHNLTYKSWSMSHSINSVINNGPTLRSDSWTGPPVSDGASKSFNCTYCSSYLLWYHLKFFR